MLVKQGWILRWVAQVMNFDHLNRTNTHSVGLGIKPTGHREYCRTEDFKTPAHHSVYNRTFEKTEAGIYNPSKWK